MKKLLAALFAVLFAASGFSQSPPSANSSAPSGVILIDPSTGSPYSPSGIVPVSTSVLPVPNIAAPISVELIDPTTGNPYKSAGSVPGGTNGQIQYNNAGAFGGYTTIPAGNLPAFGAHAATIIGCSFDTVNTAGCDFTVPSSSAQTLINSNIASCGTSQTTTFTASITGTTLTVSSSVTGTPIYVGEPLNATGLTNPTYIVSGSGTTWTVSQNHNVSSTTFTGPWPGCKVLLRSGTYNISNSIVIDRSNLTFEGENKPNFGSFIIGYNGINTVATVGMGTKIQQVGSGFPLILEGNTNVPDAGENRHRGNRVANFYIVGSSVTLLYTDTGISMQNLGDTYTIEDNYIQHVSTGIDIHLDSPRVTHNIIQDISNTAIRTEGGAIYASIQDNFVFDIGGIGIDSQGSQEIIAGNRLGDTCGNAVSNCTTIGVSGFDSLIEANWLGAVPAGAYSIYVAQGGSGGLCSIVGNHIDYSIDSFHASTRTKPAVAWNSGSQPCSVTANTFIACNGGNCGGNQEAAGVYAIDTTNTTSTSFVQGNELFPGWNNNTQPFINHPGGTASLGCNGGDTTCLNGIRSVALGGTGTGSTLTGLVRGSASAFTASEISGDCTTSGSNAITCTKINGTSFSPPLTGTTGSIGGSALLAGQCSAGTASVTGATTSMAVAASPSSDPDSVLSTGIAIYAFVSSSNTVTVRVCAIVAVTPAAVTYNVRVVQ